MATIDWPTGLPKARVGSIKDGYTPSYVSDEAQVGAPRRRKRYTRTLKKFSFKIRMTNAEAATLRTFIETTTSGGVLEFNWTHDVTGTTYEVRFPDNLPQLTEFTKGVWDSTIEIEEI